MKTAYTYSVLTGLLLACSWLIPGTPFSALLGWGTAFFTVLSLQSAFTVTSGCNSKPLNNKKKRTYFHFYVTGLIAYSIAFSWLITTINLFGGFSFFVSALIYLLFVAVSALQFLIVTFLYRYIPSYFKRFGLKATASWITAEVLFFKIFPWQLGHTQFAFKEFSQCASIGGVTLISFFMLWIAEVALKLLKEQEVKKLLIFPLLFFALLLGYGLVTLEQLRSSDFPLLTAALVQGNLSLEEKRNIEEFDEENKNKYIHLSGPFLAAKKTLLIWPESVIQSWVPTTLTNKYQSSITASLPNIPMILGSLTFDPKTKSIYNSALGVEADGTMIGTYHKRILMPFGEYTPFSRYLPFLQRLNGLVGEFSSGNTSKFFVYNFPTHTEDIQNKEAQELLTVHVSPLICYEDMLPSLSKEAVNLGADLLVNITNDAWFGKSNAPYQHNLIASFRAIENHRTLIRATNSGLTAAILPTGDLVSQLPLFQEANIMVKVPILRYKTIYTRFFGEIPFFIFSLIVSLLCINNYLQKNRRLNGSNIKNGPNHINSNRKVARSFFLRIFAKISSNRYFYSG
jgi:apolipoprotein N-acyltransferase